ncbi:sugar ABC transporter, permease [Streptomyces himastatinicus ATCC 53653]|uniref:Sugar ABC transporter, permease n=1 Tax=Streptomyces himastatinicus ATCC 53653 TaxID=457427 RepID=D9WCH0_9ACTN|nr:carbohydrate ABC transporter permease [Streptomyces himastatinicus]EFL20917.1 sugar ABC transporter, permease [Streptomyces himastatinicus ATCC 53653]
MRGHARHITAVCGHVLLLAFGATALFPLLLVLVNSFKDSSAVTANPLSLPTGLNFENFRQAWSYGHFQRGFINSFILTFTAVLVVLVCSSLAGYVLAGKKIRIWPAVMIYFMVSMTVPIQLFLFPLYFGFSRLHLLGNVAAVGVVIAAINMPLAVFLMRTFFLKVPKEVEEAALVDGANTFQLLRSVILPVVSPGLVTVATIVGLMAWNEFLITSTFLQGDSSMTATLGYLSMNGTFSTNQGVMMAGAVILVGPIIVIFVMLQRYFVDGFVSGSVKG